MWARNATCVFPSLAVVLAAFAGKRPRMSVEFPKKLVGRLQWDLYGSHAACLSAEKRREGLRAKAKGFAAEPSKSAAITLQPDSANPE
jgi:hypothetical protein